MCVRVCLWTHTHTYTLSFSLPITHTYFTPTYTHTHTRTHTHTHPAGSAAVPFAVLEGGRGMRGGGGVKEGKPLDMLRHLILQVEKEVCVHVCTHVRVFCRYIGLFCGDMGLNGGDVGLFCRDVGLFCGPISHNASKCDRSSG